jgi:2-haloalkanoic acid dehalogenase type II
MSLTDYKVLSFDCYGTLIDWESGIHSALRRILNKLPPSHRYHTQPLTIVERFNSLQAPLEAQRPDLLYTDILATCYGKLGREEGVETTEEERKTFGHSVKDWPAFSDSVSGLQRLKKHYKLIILSNVDNENIRATLTGALAEVKFDAVYTAQDIGAYKPNHKNFTYLLDHVKSELKLEQSQLLHAAKSLTADHVPAKQLGLISAWIARGDDGHSAMGGKLTELETEVGFAWRFPSIEAMADAVEREFQASG